MDKPKVRGKPFQKGNKLGTGRPKLPDDLRALIRATGEQMRKDLCEAYLMPLMELQSSEGNPNLTAGRAAVISCLNNAIQSADLRGLYLFFDRILGKVQEASILDEEKPVDQKDETINKLVAMMLDKPK